MFKSVDDSKKSRKFQKFPENTRNENPRTS